MSIYVFSYHSICVVCDAICVLSHTTPCVLILWMLRARRRRMLQHASYTPRTRLVHASCTPLTRLLHASCTPVQGTYASHALSVHAFGVDTPATFNSTHTDWHSHPKLFEYVSVGMFAPWKRHQHIIEKPGRRLVVGYVC